MTLTKEEYKQLEAIKILFPDSHWVTRSKNGGVSSHYDKPKRQGDYWESFLEATLSDNSFPSLTWESEPLNIDEALEGRENET